jgi:hypothetical protein
MNPKPTLRQAIDRFCLSCQHNDLFAVANCDNIECALHSVRANQRLKGCKRSDFSDKELVQIVADALAFPKLKEKGLEYL